jgi:hypothetical protein
MLSQLVRPMVQTQIRLLANSRATRSTLVSTVSQWLSFLGVNAQVTYLDAQSGKIQIALMVHKPDGCDSRDWQQILDNLTPNAASNSSSNTLAAPREVALEPQQHSKMQRLLAYLIQVGNPDQPTPWDDLHPKLQELGFDESTLIGIRSALKVPQCLDDLLADLDPDLAAIALPKAVNLAMMDRQVNASEDQALTALLNAMKREIRE